MSTRRNARWIPLLILMLAFSTLPGSANTDTRPEIGLVLSGGGAKGFAHIGVLKMLDSLQITVDYITGTSMGGILGALYSIGYSGIEIEKMITSSDWNEIFTDQPPRQMLPYFNKKMTGRYQLEFGLDSITPVPRSGLIYGQKISLLFRSLTFPYENVKNFDELPIPFRCIAVDLVSGNEVHLKSGSLAKAMRATMAIPTVFSPVEWGDSLLVDGGMSNNLPVDVVQKMGADIVIAVDVGSKLKNRQDLNSAISILQQTISIMGRERYRNNIINTNLLIQPDLSSFNLAQFNSEKVKEILKAGETAARQSRSDLITMKEQFHLQRYQDHSTLYTLPQDTRVHTIQITGHTSIPFQNLYRMIGIKPGDVLEPNILRDRIADLKTSGKFESINVEWTRHSEKFVRLMVRVKEREKPIIAGIDIHGNNHYSESFLKQLLKLAPGDTLHTEVLNQQIMRIYALNEFEHIHYDIDPLPDNRVDLTLDIKELPLRRIHLGLRYDDHHKLVAAARIRASNVFSFLPKLNLDSELQFAGLTRFYLRATYPTEFLGLTLLPFFHQGMKSIPTRIVDTEGNQIAEYQDKSTTAAWGVGVMLSKSLYSELNLVVEEMDVSPNIAFPDPDLFPSWQDTLNQATITLDLDTQDDALLPHNGINATFEYEASLQKFKSDVPYMKLSSSIDMYKTLWNRHTIRIYGFYGNATEDLPVYKYFNKSKPEYMVGMQYDQIMGYKLALLRLGYRLKYRNNIYFKWMGNVIWDYEYGDHPYPATEAYPLFGTGLGVLYESPLGPIQVIASVGDKKLQGQREAQSVVYFKLGYRF